MVTYKNTSIYSRQFYGVSFKPGEIQSVPGYINATGMVRVSDNNVHTNKLEKPVKAEKAEKKQLTEVSQDTEVTAQPSQSTKSQKGGNTNG